MLHAQSIIEIVYKSLKPVSIVKCMVTKISNHIFDISDNDSHHIINLCYSSSFY